MMTLPNNAFIHKYLAHTAESMRADLHEVLAMMRTIAPDAELSFDLGIPYFQQDSEFLFGVAARDNHLCIYFDTCPVFYSFKERLNQVQFGQNCLIFHRLQDININVFAELLSQIKVYSVKQGRNRSATVLH
ncbi:MAG: DUF1801 domain-containing protein [Marinomonas sp.]